MTASCQPPGWVLSAALANHPGPKAWVPCVGGVRVAASPPSKDSGSTSLLAPRCRVASPARVRRPSPESPLGETPLTSLPRRNEGAWPNSDWFPTPTTVMLWPPKRPPRHRVLGRQEHRSTHVHLAPSATCPEEQAPSRAGAPCLAPAFPSAEAPRSTRAERRITWPRTQARSTWVRRPIHRIGTDISSESGRNHHLPNCQRRGVPRLPPHPLPGQTFSASPAEQPTSRLYSTDESVACQCRFQHRSALSFHGLCSQRIPAARCTGRCQPPTEAGCQRRLRRCPRAPSQPHPPKRVGWHVPLALPTDLGEPFSAASSLLAETSSNSALAQQLAGCECVARRRRWRAVELPKVLRCPPLPPLRSA